MSLCSESIDDYVIYSLPLEDSLNIDDDKWEDAEGPGPEVASSKKKKIRKFTIPLTFAFVAIGALAGAVLSGSSNSIDEGISLEQMQSTNVDEGSQHNTHETTKSSKSSKSGRGSMGGETIGSDWESESMSMSFYFRDINTFMSMSAPSIALGESMSFPSIEIASMSLPSVESMSLSLSSIESLLLSLPTIDSISLSLPSIEIESVSLIENAFIMQDEYESRPDGVGSMSLPSIESLSLSLPPIESISLSLPSIDINSLSLNDNSFNVHKKIGSRPNRVGTKGSKRDTSDIITEENSGSLSLSMPSATRFLEFDEYDETDSIHTQFNAVHDGPVFRRKKMEIISSN